MIPLLANLFDNLPADDSMEHFQSLHTKAGVEIERIVSYAHPTPPGSWYDQPHDEWVLLLRGTACLEYETDRASLHAGDYLFIPAHLKHRVESVSADAIWLAIHFRDN